MKAERSVHEQVELAKEPTKEVVLISYEGSGINSLDGFKFFFFVMAGMILIASLIVLVAMEEDGVFMFVSLLLSSLVCLFFGVICAGLSTIAEAALMQKSLFQEKYDFKMKKEVVTEGGDQ